MITLTDTTSSKIAKLFLKERKAAGSPAMGMVMTLVVITDEEHSASALKAARTAAKEHPARVLAVQIGSGRGRGRVDAEVGIGRGRSGETALITLTGEVVKYADSVVRPLLLPDSPVAVWWAANSPVSPSEDPIGMLAQRRITDASAVTKGRTKALERLCRNYAPGDTDLAWSRITPWRALLAAALDQHSGKVTGVTVAGERLSPSTDLLAAWLEDRLHVQAEQHTTEGPGITEVVLTTAAGDVRIQRTDGSLATLSVPGAMDRRVSLRRRELPELLAEELRHLDEDEIYAETVRHIARVHEG